MLIEQIAADFRKALAVNATVSSYPSRIPTTTEPATDGVFSIGPGVTHKRVCVIPYALGADNDTMSVRVIGWRQVGLGGSTKPVWVPYLLGEITATVSQAVGVAGAAVLDTERLADTLALVTGTNPDFVDVNSPTGNIVGFATFDLQGSTKVEFSPIVGVTPTSVNCLWCLTD